MRHTSEFLPVPEWDPGCVSWSLSDGASQEIPYDSDARFETVIKTLP